MQSYKELIITGEMDRSNVLLLAPCGGAMWFLLYNALQLHNKITPKISENICGLLAVAVMAVWPLFNDAWPIDFGRGDERNTQWQQDILLFATAFYLYDINHYLFSSAPIRTRHPMIIHHSMTLVIAIIYHYFEIFGYAMSILMFLIETPVLTHKVALLLIEKVGKDSKIYRSFRMFSYIFVVVNRTFGVTYVAYGFLTNSRSSKLFKTVTVIGYVLNVFMCMTTFSALLRHLSKINPRSAEKIGKE